MQRVQIFGCIAHLLCTCYMVIMIFCGSNRILYEVGILRSIHHIIWRLCGMRCVKIVSDTVFHARIMWSSASHAECSGSFPQRTRRVLHSLRTGSGTIDSAKTARYFSCRNFEHSPAKSELIACRVRVEYPYLPSDTTQIEAFKVAGMVLQGLVWLGGRVKTESKPLKLSRFPNLCFQAIVFPRVAFESPCEFDFSMKLSLESAFVNECVTIGMC